MSARKRKTWAELTDEERAKVEAFRARHQTPEALAQEEADRQAIMLEFPPKDGSVADRAGGRA